MTERASAVSGLRDTISTAEGQNADKTREQGWMLMKMQSAEREDADVLIACAGR